MYSSVNLMSFVNGRPQASASVKGSADFPEISGTVDFYQRREGVIVVAAVSGLPAGDNNCSKPIFAFHIHSGGSCGGSTSDYFSDALAHYNPHGCPHPYHAGDLPPLFGCAGLAFSAFMTDRLSVNEIIGRTVIIHSAPDDFTTQPSGNSGTKIACGVIEPR